MIDTLHSSSAPHNEARLKQLDKLVQAPEWQLLRTNRQEVSEFLRLGRKWGFFSLAEKTSKKAGREVLANAYMPESNLAVLIDDRDPQNLSAIERNMDEGLLTDRKYVAAFLISRIKELYRKESSSHGTVALDVGNAPEMLAKEQDPKNYLRWVKRPAPVHAVPAWFQVIEKYGMGPADLDMIYTRMDEESAKSSAAKVTEVASGEHDAIMKASDAA